MSIDEFDFSEPEPTKNMEIEDTLCLTASKAELNISSLFPGFFQPAPSDLNPLAGVNLPGFSQPASSDPTTSQPAPVLQPVEIPQPQLSQKELHCSASREPG